MRHTPSSASTTARCALTPNPQRSDPASIGLVHDLVPAGPALQRTRVCEHPQQRCCPSQTESIGRTDRGDVGTNTELHSEALSIDSTGPPDADEMTSQTDKWSILNDEVRALRGQICRPMSGGALTRQILQLQPGGSCFALTDHGSVARLYWLILSSLLLNAIRVFAVALSRCSPR